MTIEIHKPELKALIMERLESGKFEDIEDILIKALRLSMHTSEKATKVTERDRLMGADLIAVMQESPLKDIDLEPARERLPVRQVVL